MFSSPGTPALGPYHFDFIGTTTATTTTTVSHPNCIDNPHCVLGLGDSSTSDRNFRLVSGREGGVDATDSPTSATATNSSAHYSERGGEFIQPRDEDCPFVGLKVIHFFRFCFILFIFFLLFECCLVGFVLFSYFFVIFCCFLLLFVI